MFSSLCHLSTLGTCEWIMHAHKNGDSANRKDTVLKLCSTKSIRKHRQSQVYLKIMCRIRACVFLPVPSHRRFHNCFKLFMVAVWEKDLVAKHQYRPWPVLHISERTGHDPVLSFWLQKVLVSVLALSLFFPRPHQYLQQRFTKKRSICGAFFWFKWI